MLWFIKLKAVKPLYILVLMILSKILFVKVQSAHEMSFGNF